MDDDEQATDVMMARGNKIVADAVAHHKPVAMVAAFSGGDDSIVTTDWAARVLGAPALHCATTTGCQETLCHIRSFCQSRKIELIEKTAPVEGPPQPRPGREKVLDVKSLPAGRWTDGETAYEEIALNFGFPGPAQHGRMYTRLKGRSIAAFTREAKVGQKRTATVMIISGIRHDESRIRAGYQRAVTKVGGQVWVNPFYYASAADFAAYRSEFGLPSNPVKKIVGVSGECNCGAYATPNEMERLKAASPATAKKILDLQERVHASGFPWDWGTRPPQWFLDSRRGQMFLEFEDAGDWQPMCVGCGKERRLS